MINHNDFQAAVTLAQSARRNAAGRRRSAGDPHDPFRAKAGQEPEFYEAVQSVRAYRLILKLLEKEARRTVTKPLQRLAGICIRTGELTLATFGFAAALTLLRLPAPVIQAAAIIGVSVALARSLTGK